MAVNSSEEEDPPHEISLILYYPYAAMIEETRHNKKNVSFSPEVKVRPIRNVMDDYTYEEIDSTWYSIEEVKALTAETYLAAQQIDLLEEHDNFQFQFCQRGLERISPQGKKKALSIRRRAAVAVFHAQDCEPLDDPEFIARAYKEISGYCQIDATEKGTRCFAESTKERWLNECLFSANREVSTSFRPQVDGALEIIPEKLLVTCRAA
jgi:hypothetical protein